MNYDGTFYIFYKLIPQIYMKIVICIKKYKYLPQLRHLWIPKNCGLGFRCVNLHLWIRPKTDITTLTPSAAPSPKASHNIISTNNNSSLLYSLFALMKDLGTRYRGNFWGLFSILLHFLSFCISLNFTFHLIT